MTAQIDDTFIYQGREYAVAGISEGELFDPAMFGFAPVGTCSACWRGYLAVFGLAETRLVLKELHINLLVPGHRRARLEGPEINGVKPTRPRVEDDFLNNHYDGLSYPLGYSGGLLLADGFFHELYVHMGFHPAWKYERVVELVFESGHLQRAVDRSEQMATERKRLADPSDADAKRRMLSGAGIKEFVRRAFDRTYRM